MVVIVVVTGGVILIYSDSVRYIIPCKKLETGGLSHFGTSAVVDSGGLGGSGTK